MIVTAPSFQAGFAGRGFRPRYPGLWQGCVGAWAPVLGYTGVTIKDRSGYGNDLTFTNYDNTQWVRRGGVNALEMETTSPAKYVSGIYNPITGSAARAISGWIYWPANTQYGILTDAGAVATRQRMLLFIAKTTPYAGAVGQMLAEFNTGTYGSVATIAVATWTHVYYQLEGNISAGAFYFNGVDAGYNQKLGSPGTAATATTNAIHLGSAIDHPTDSTHKSAVADLRIYNRFLSLAEIQLLARRPGIAYEVVRPLYSGALPAGAAGASVRQTFIINT